MKIPTYKTEQLKCWNKAKEISRTRIGLLRFTCSLPYRHKLDCIGGNDTIGVIGEHHLDLLPACKGEGTKAIPPEFGARRIEADDLHAIPVGNLVMVIAPDLRHCP